MAAHLDTDSPRRASDAGSRPGYVPRARVERYIVPLLAAAIPSAIEQHLKPLAPGRVLDVGCGRQPFRALLESAGFTYTAMDAAQNVDGTVEFVGMIDGVLPTPLLQAARERGTPLDASGMDVAPETHPAGSPGFDAILCTEVLEHVADWHAAFANFATLLRPGGRLLATCPAAYPPHEEPYDFWRPTPHALKWYADRHGFRIIKLTRLGTALDVVGTMLAATRPRAKVPILGHAWALVMQITRSAAAAILCGPVSRTLTRDSGGVFQSTLVVLERV